ncbi:hypothetical protein [Yoonia sp. BS5-3]|uniref:RNase NYN domain-containing protein n=1 Tax=Yoonia phaeophyticola TaxID=3137369 RepID=A0ABZ2V1X5_9RHOB
MAALKTLCIGLIVVMVVAGGVLPETADKARIIDGIGKGIFVSFGLVVLGYLAGMTGLLKSRETQEEGTAEQPVMADASASQSKVEITDRSVLVDGTNVMNWGGSPSLQVLTKVVRELQIRGLDPVVYFNDNVGKELTGKRMKPAALATELGLGKDRVIFAPKQVPADEIMLEHAVNDGLRVVTNDQYANWTEKFPKVSEAGFLIKGFWKGGAVILLGLGRSSAMS